MEPLKRTPLFAHHQAAKARIVPFAGWEMPVQYAGVIPEVKAVRTGIGLFDVSHMGRLRVHGDDALPFLQYVTVNNLNRLPQRGGMAQYSLLCRDAGGIIDDIIVYRLGRNEFVVVVNASNADKDIAWLTHHKSAFPHLTMEVETDQTALIAVQGPQAVALCDHLSDKDIGDLPRFGVDESLVANVPCMVARTGYTGEDGFELFCPAEEAADLWERLVEAGSIPCGLGARDTLRIEAALPLYGHEMDEHTHPFAARLGWVFRDDKTAEYIGKSVLTDLKAAPKSKTLVGLEMDGRAIPRENYLVEVDGKMVGTVTSGTYSPTKEKGVAIARIDALHSKAKTVDVVVRETRHTARIVPLPFYKNL